MGCILAMFIPLSASLNTEPLDATSAAASINIYITMDMLLLGSYTKFSSSLIKWKTQKAKKTIPPSNPLYLVPSPPTGLKNWPLNEFHVSKLNWW